MARTPSQKLAVATVRKAAKQMIEEIDRRHDPRQTEFTAYFHLETWRIERRQFQGGPCEFWHGGKVFKTVSARLPSP